MLQLPEVQEFVAETRERHALMTTRKARRYQRGSIGKSHNGEIWYGKYYPAPGAPQKRVQLGRVSEMDEKHARIALDDVVAVLNRNTGLGLEGELVQRFVNQVYIPQKYENGDWRKATGQEAERLFRRSILPEIGAMRCRDLRAAHLREVLRKLASAGWSRGPVSQVRCALVDMVHKMMAEGYMSFDIAKDLKTPATAKPSDRTRLRRVTLSDYLQAWTVLDERERLAFDLVTFCGLRESEAYGLRNADLIQDGAIRVERSWYRGTINPTKTDQSRIIGIEAEIFKRLQAWMATLLDRSHAGWLFPSERIITPLLPDNVLRRCVRPRLKPLGLDWINFAVLRRSHSTLHKEKVRTRRSLRISKGTASGFTWRNTSSRPLLPNARPSRHCGQISEA